MQRKPEDLQVSPRSPIALDSEEIHPLMELAVEMRRRVTDRFAKSRPTEFSGIQHGFKLTR
jgi:predicted ATP-dependent Lon-type protease